MDAKHDDTGKPTLDQLPFRGLELVSRVLEFGSAKYGKGNWRSGAKWSRFFASTLRHLFAWGRGVDYDPESKLPHLAHAACNILFLLEWQDANLGEDDR